MTAAAIVAAVVLISLWAVWERTASTTRIALVNFQPFQVTGIVRANTDRFITYEELPFDRLHRLKRYDFVLAFGMGLNVSAEQRAQIQAAADGGTPVYVFSPTSPENNICNLDSLTRAGVNAYLSNGNTTNYRRLAQYVRQTIDGKRFFTHTPDSAAENSSDVLYHLDANVSFSEVPAYEDYLKEKGFYTEGAPKAVIVGGLNDPFSGNKDNLDSMIVRFHRAGLNVYPVSSAMKRLSFICSIRPDAVVYLAHGRLAMGQADAAVDWLKENNVPLFCPLTLLQTEEEWLADPMGMMGGFMSQSIVMPELDGGIYPYVLNAQVIGEDGLYLFKTIPGRLENFTRLITNFIRLKQLPNAGKKLAIYYFKGPGQSTLAAQGLETVPSLYYFLKRLKAEGYTIDNLPPDVKGFEQLLMTQGAVLSTYSEGAFDDFLRNGYPELVETAQYESWVEQALPSSLYQEVTQRYGKAPGSYMAVEQDGKQHLAVARIRLGNVVLLPQPMAGLGGDAFAIVHGAKSAPPHTYIASYLWTQYGFKADAMLHFGTHGSLEFTPQKQMALSEYDWPDRLTGTVPHFYYYTIGNIGESMMAKRRSYAVTVSYLTPPFSESGARAQFKDLQERIRDYYRATEADRPGRSLGIKQIALQMGLHRDLRLDSVAGRPYTAADIERIENFAEEIAGEKISGRLYTSGVPYEKERIRSTVLAMSADPIAYSVANLDRARGKVSAGELKHKAFFTQRYGEPAQALVQRVLDGTPVNEALVCATAGITPAELAEAREILTPPTSGMRAAMMQMAAAGGAKPAGASPPSGGGHPSWIPKVGKQPESTKQAARPAAASPKDTVAPKKGFTPEQKARARAIVEVERTLTHINDYRDALESSPEREFKALLNALAGGYTPPSSGGDAVANPNAVPTGRNLYAINADATPSETAWEKGVSLVNATLEQYRNAHEGAYPRKVSYTFWSSELIETEGATIAQALYMLGVEPVRDSYGRVSDLQLIPPDALKRPRIDVVVQTSGQFRDLAASRLALLSRAVEMAAAAKDEDAATENFVAPGTVEMERLLVDRGFSPKDARELSVQRIFGGVNGGYGTGIQEMVTAGDRWESEEEIAAVYLQNMGALYANEKRWGDFHQDLFRIALHNADVVVQPRQSNTWGALSLDHVYEFMGGLNLAVRQVTGKDPDAFFADYRNRNNVRMQEIKEAVGVEARATIFNPAYIREVVTGGQASAAAQIAEIVTNTYGWQVMKPAIIDPEMWDNIYDIYVEDRYGLGVEPFFRRENPFALQEMTAVMLETARKGMWKASDAQLAGLARLHTALVEEFGSGGSGFAGGNVRLQDFIAQKVDPSVAANYRRQIRQMKEKASDTGAEPSSGALILKEDAPQTPGGEETRPGGVIVGVIVVCLLILAGVLVVKRKREKDA
jgi:cobaltochelatase CobN